MVKLRVSGILALVFCFSGGLALAQPPEIVVGHDGYYTCQNIRGEVSCRGLNVDSILEVPPLPDARSLTSGTKHVCAISRSRVFCWGDNQLGQTTVPELKNPTQVIAGGSNTCAYDDEGLHCWGDDNEGQISKLSQLKDAVPSATSVSVGGGYDQPGLICLMSSTDVRCIGFFWSPKYRFKGLKHPRSVAANIYSACVLDAKGVLCKENDNSPTYRIRQLEEAHRIVSGGEAYCALLDRRAMCWRFRYSKAETIREIPLGERVENFAVHGNRYCYIDSREQRICGRMEGF
jgi:hypothetical protein